MLADLWCIRGEIEADYAGKMWLADLTAGFRSGMENVIFLALGNNG